jgi:hypothetical protein
MAPAPTVSRCATCTSEEAPEAQTRFHEFAWRDQAMASAPLGARCASRVPGDKRPAGRHEGVSHDSLDAAGAGRRVGCVSAQTEIGSNFTLVMPIETQTAVPVAFGAALPSGERLAHRHQLMAAVPFFVPPDSNPLISRAIRDRRAGLENRYGRFRPSRVRIPPSPLGRSELALTTGVVRRFCRCVWVNVGQRGTRATRMLVPPRVPPGLVVRRTMPWVSRTVARPVRAGPTRANVSQRRPGCYGRRSLPASVASVAERCVPTWECQTWR